ncbi:response regulator [Kribbella sp. CA-293567]|uniref:response regulator n=1 Tax=Kribbella sp. CA-293567 TaxID=3002436 RepID=UPI0022DE436B|nr:response regulator transcription factor [Kribbella sp. CA-293567]WBQ02111.1 response regulator transcription factor [Kribbella sp. CA-293567]
MVVRMLVVDDDALVRAGLRAMLGGAPELEIVGDVGDGRAAVDAVLELRPDVVLMDITMPVMDGLTATELIRGRAEAPEVVILTTFGSEEHLLQALRAGAAGFLLKDAAPQEILDAVVKVAGGDPILSGAVTRQLMDYVAGPDDQSRRDRALGVLAKLTEREREVAAAVAQGKSNAEIAAGLSMGVPTVKTHLTRVLTKLDLNNRVQVALLAHDAGLA